MTGDNQHDLTEISQIDHGIGFVEKTQEIKG